MEPRRTVVVVDDAEDVRMLVRTTLEFDGRFEVIGEAADGSSAVALVDQLRPDVVVLDVDLPGTGGVEALEELRSRTPGVRVVMASAYDPGLLASMSASAGADGWIHKGEVFYALCDQLADMCGLAPTA
jgi:DNA-binding NarL/FixJ family response regulator